MFKILFASVILLDLFVTYVVIITEIVSFLVSRLASIVIYTI